MRVRLARRTFPPALVFAAVGFLALENGGFFATSWGWPALVFLLAAAVVVAQVDRMRVGRLDLLLLAALAAFVGWTALSALWAPGAELPLQAAELALVYLAAVAALLLFGSSELSLGILAAVAPIAAYALATRLVPDHIGTYNPGENGYLLAGTTGYQNCLGMLCALGSLIALGAIAHAQRLALRCAAALALMILLPTLYFTFSRGAAATLALGAVVAVALERERLRFTLTSLAALALPLIGVWLASRSGPLTHAGAPLSAAARDGHRVAIALLVLGAPQAAAVLALAKAERRVEVTQRMRRAATVAVGVGVVAALVAVLVRIGNPVSFVNHATDAFTTETAAAGGNLNRRLVTLSGHTRSQYWSAAWHEVRDNPLLGGGGGTFRRSWLRYRHTPVAVQNAHNLYLETLAELGPVGLSLLLSALAMPIAALRRARGHPLVPVVAGAYVAALLHAAVDWDWQLPAVTLCTFALGSTLVIAARRPHAEVRVTRPIRTTAIALSGALIVFVFVAQLGNDALAGAERAANRGQAELALSDARDARKWLPWAATPWQRIGEAQLASGAVADARSSFYETIRLDGSNWESWLDLALTATGAERRRALSRVAHLNPLSQALPARIPAGGV